MSMIPYKPLQNLKVKSSNKYVLSAIASVMAIIGTASADITTDLANFSQIIGNASTGFTGYFINMMTIFMQPPLVYFVVLGFFITFVHMAGSFLMKRGKK